jgi:hypothetical protein
MTQKELQVINFLHFLNMHPWLLVALYALAIWVIIWKGIALWKAARNGSKVWYVVLLVVNTVGILEIIYTFYFSKKDEIKNS